MKEKSRGKQTLFSFRDEKCFLRPLWSLMPQSMPKQDFKTLVEKDTSSSIPFSLRDQVVTWETCFSIHFLFSLPSFSPPFFLVKHKRDIMKGEHFALLDPLFICEEHLFCVSFYSSSSLSFSGVNVFPLLVRHVNVLEGSQTDYLSYNRTSIGLTSCDNCL